MHVVSLNPGSDDLGGIAQLNPASETGRQQIHHICLMTAQVYLEEASPEASAEVAQWMAAFLAEGVLQGMVSTPAELRIEDVEELLLHVLTEDPQVLASDPDQVVTVLQDFWRYLGRVYRFPNAGLVASTLGRLRPRFMELITARLTAQTAPQVGPSEPTWINTLHAAEASRKRKRKLARAARRVNKKKR